jgi:hypothetical protein
LDTLIFYNQVTDLQTLVFSQENLELLKPETISHHIVRLAKERDMYHSNWISSFCNENIDTLSRGGAAKSNAIDGSQNNSTASNAVTPSSSTASSLPDNNHLAVELADIKSRLRKLRQEL